MYDIQRGSKMKTTKTITWQAIEDNGGGLHLAVFEKKTASDTGIEKCMFFRSGYENFQGSLKGDMRVLEVGGSIEVNWIWNENDLAGCRTGDPTEMYNELTGYEYGWKIVADESGVYLDSMGAAAKREFGDAK